MAAKDSYETNGKPTMRSAEGVSLLYYMEHVFDEHLKAIVNAKAEADRAIVNAKAEADRRIDPLVDIVAILKTCADKAAGRAGIATWISLIALLVSVAIHFLK